MLSSAISTSLIDDPDLSPPPGTLKLSQTSPDVPNAEAGAHPHKDLPNAHSQQQVTSRSVGLVERGGATEGAIF